MWPAAVVVATIVDCTVPDRRNNQWFLRFVAGITVVREDPELCCVPTDTPFEEKYLSSCHRLAYIVVVADD